MDQTQYVETTSHKPPHHHHQYEPQPQQQQQQQQQQYYNPNVQYFPMQAQAAQPPQPYQPAPANNQTQQFPGFQQRPSYGAQQISYGPPPVGMPIQPQQMQPSYPNVPNVAPYPVDDGYGQQSQLLQPVRSRDMPPRRSSHGSHHSKHSHRSDDDDYEGECKHEHHKHHKHHKYKEEKRPTLGDSVLSTFSVLKSALGPRDKD